MRAHNTGKKLWLVMVVCGCFFPAVSFGIDTPAFVYANVCLSDKAVDATVECYAEQGITLGDNDKFFVSDPARMVEYAVDYSFSKNGGGPCRNKASQALCRECMKPGLTALQQMAIVDKKVKILRNSIRKAVTHYKKFSIDAECEDAGAPQG